MKNSSKSPLVQGCIQPDRWVWGAHAPKSPNLKSCIPGPDATNPTVSFIKISGLGMEGFVSPVEMQHFAEKGALSPLDGGPGQTPKPSAPKTS